MKLRIFIILVLSSFNLRISAQVNAFTKSADPHLFERVSPNGFVTFNRNQSIIPDQFWEVNKFGFGMDERYNMIHQQTIRDFKGKHHYRFQQLYEGIPVYGGFYSLLKTADDGWAGSGKIITPGHINQVIHFSEAEALQIVLGGVHAESYYWENALREYRLRKKKGAQATYFPKASFEYLPDPSDTSLQLCYTFNIYCLPENRSGKYYVSTDEGRVLKFLPAVHTCSAANFVSIFNGDQVVNTYFNGDEYELENDCNSSVYGVYDEMDDLDIFTSANNTWLLPRRRSAATSLWVIKRSYFAYKNVFDLDGHDNNNGDIDIYFDHYFTSNDSYFNASFTYDPIGDDEINVGTGHNDPAEDDYVTVDILGHEFSHGVDTYTAGLVYQGESGALNESFADIFGEWVEDQTEGSHDWYMGRDRESNNGCPTPLRYFADPADQNHDLGNNCYRDFNQPNTYQGTFWFDINSCDPEDEDSDNCGVHRNSGVQNQMFYLLAEGGSGVNNGNTCHAVAGGYAWSVDGIGMNAAIQIGFLALSIFMGPNDQYEDARNAWVQAAIVLYGECSNEAMQTGKAWYAVGFAPPSESSLVLCNHTYGANSITVENQTEVITDENCSVTISGTGNLVQFKAGTYVKLKPGFHALTGSLFKAVNTDCEYATF